MDDDIGDVVTIQLTPSFRIVPWDGEAENSMKSHFGIDLPDVNLYNMGARRYGCAPIQGQTTTAD